MAPVFLKKINFFYVLNHFDALILKKKLKKYIYYFDIFQHKK